MTRELGQTWHGMLSVNSLASSTVACDAPVEREKRPRGDKEWAGVLMSIDVWKFLAILGLSSAGSTVRGRSRVMSMRRS